MSASVRGPSGQAAAVTGGGGATSIPASARKVVQNLKEIVGHSDEEIYAMLKECNMDPNETAQRLISQDTFHEVKRKRDKKKEAQSNIKEGFENRSRPAGSFRGGRGDRGVGRGSQPRYTASESGNGRGRPREARENGGHFSSAANVSSAVESAPVKPAPSAAGTAGASTALTNGSAYYPTIPAPQGAWSKVPGATMADILKSGTAHAASVVVPNTASQAFPSPGMYPSSDPVHHPSSDYRASGASTAIKRDIGIVGNQRAVGDRLSVTVPSQGQPRPTDDDAPIASSPGPREAPKSPDNLPDSSTSEVQQPSRTAASTNGRPGPQAGNAHKEWKPKAVQQDVTVPGLNTVESVVTEALKSPPASVVSDNEALSVASKFQNLNTRDDQQVVMPTNFQSQAADLGLSFGSFGESYASSLPSGFSSEDGLDISAPSEADSTTKDAIREQQSSGPEVTTQDSSMLHQNEMPVELDSRNDAAGSYSSQPDMSKLRSSQAQQQFSYLQPTQSYSSSGLGMTPQIPTSQHGFESSDSHLQDLSAVSSAMKQQQHYTDTSSTSFYSPGFRPGADADGRYPQYLQAAAAAAKYNSGAVMVPGQHLPLTTEVGNSAGLSSTTSASQTATNTHSLPTAPQQPLVHAFPAQPAGVPMGHFTTFSYPYPSYTFVPSYQHSFNTSYPQPPVSSYPPSANYAAVKYPLPQYKPGTATANAPLSAATAGYGGYGSASSMYANPAATTTNSSGYEDVSGAQFKDNMYLHTPQGDRIWIQSHTGDAAAAAAQTSSFYALSGQNQHTSYTQPSSHTHPMAGYTSLYHQPGPAGSGHQLIQPQTLSGAAGSTQVGSTYQRMQPNWNY